MSSIRTFACGAILALSFAGAASAADTEADGAKAAVNALVGCWKGAGQVKGTPTDNDVVVTPRLDGKYLTVAVTSRDPKNPYRAVVILAWAGGRRLTSFWMDTFGGEYSAAGSGAVASDGALEITYPYPDADFVNTFIRSGNGLFWEIVEKKHGAPSRNFATYSLFPVSCDGKHADF